MPTRDELYMLRALELAGRGRGTVEPNPMVGAVIVRQRSEKVLAEGYHERFGGSHAEIEALSSARRAGEDVTGATMYVTLEPCRHHGKTPPCTDAVIRSGVSRVVVAMKDPDEKAAGKGLEQLRQAGLDVTVGTSQQQARKLLAGYVKLRTLGRPWVICKWAQTADGYIALPPGYGPAAARRGGRWISGQASRRRVHELRGRCDGILVGLGTVLSDDPLLTDRRAGGKGAQPVRVVLDSGLRIPPNCRLIRTAGQSPVIVVTTKDAVRANPTAPCASPKAGVEILHMPPGRGGVQLEALLDEFGRREWTYLLVEGGRSVLENFISTGLADELMVFISPKTVGSLGKSSPRFDVAEVVAPDAYTEDSRAKIGRDTLLRYLRCSPLEHH